MRSKSGRCVNRLAKRVLAVTLMAYLQGLLGPDPKTVNDILTALWTGLASQMAGKAHDAGGEAYSECLAWTLSQVTILGCMLYRYAMVCG